MSRGPCRDAAPTWNGFVGFRARNAAGIQTGGGAGHLCAKGGSCRALWLCEGNHAEGSLELEVRRSTGGAALAAQHWRRSTDGAALTAQLWRRSTGGAARAAQPERCACLLQDGANSEFGGLEDELRNQALEELLHLRGYAGGLRAWSALPRQRLPLSGPLSGIGGCNGARSAAAFAPPPRQTARSSSSAPVPPPQNQSLVTRLARGTQQAAMHGKSAEH